MDVIVAIDAKEDLSKILGRHLWGEMLHPGYVQYVLEKEKCKPLV